MFRHIRLNACWIALTTLVVCMPPSSGRSQDVWPRFRGDNGSGISEGTTIPAKWSSSDYLWTADLPGRGHSSPVVWKDHLFLTSADAQRAERYVMAFHALTGDVLWQKTFPLPKHRTHKNNSYASSTPAVDETHVYVLMQSPESSHLVAFSHQGKEQWRSDVGAYKHGQGPAVSLIAHKGRVVLCNDHKDGSFVAAFSAQDGKPIWKIDREGKRACYATPCIRNGSRGDEVVFSHCYEGVIGVDLESGQVNWKADPFGRASQRAIGSPFNADGLLIASSGARTGDKYVVALEVSDGAREPVERYRVTRSAAPHVPTAIAYRGRLFLWADVGIVTCVELDSGKRVWQKRIGGNYFGSPICVGGRLVCVDVDGVAVVIDAGDKFRELGRVDLGDPTHATPAAANGAIYFRTASRISALKGE